MITQQQPQNQTTQQQQQVQHLTRQKQQQTQQPHKHNKTNKPSLRERAILRVSHRHYRVDMLLIATVLKGHTSHQVGSSPTPKAGLCEDGGMLCTPSHTPQWTPRGSLGTLRGVGGRPSMAPHPADPSTTLWDRRYWRSL
jgi:hypothetical protein